MNLFSLIALGLCVLVFAVTQRLLKNRSRRQQLLWSAIFLVLAGPALLSAIYYLHILPEAAWFYEMRALRGSEFFMLSLGAAGGAMAAVLPRMLTPLPLFCSISLAAIPYLKPVLYPLPGNSWAERWDGDACQQSTASTFGPASTATVLKSLDITSSEREIAQAAFTCGSGTEAWYLARYCRGRGLKVQFEFSRGPLSTLHFPAIVGVLVGKAGHFIAVVDLHEVQVVFADPLRGQATLPVTEFRQRYSFTGFQMVVSKPR
jgi:Peptidase C39 family